MSEGVTNLRWAGACYGVDPQGEKLVIVRAERRRGRLSLSTVPDRDADFVESVRKGTPCIGSLSPRESLTRWLEAPFAARRKADKVFPTLLDIQLPFDLEDCAYCFLPAAGRQGVTRALAVAARLEEVRKKVDSLAALGIDAMALDHEGLALWTQSLREEPVRPGDEKVLRVLVNARGEQSCMVVGRGGEFLSAHGVRIGDTGQIRRLLKPYKGSVFSVQGSGQGELRAEDGGLRTGEHSTLNAQRSTFNESEAAGAGAKARWFWAGPGAADTSVVSGLHGALSKEWPGASVVHTAPETFLARALAVRAMTGGPLACNLRSGSLIHPAVAKRSRRQLARAAAVFLMAGLVLCACNVAARLTVRQREAAVDREFASLAADLAGEPVKAKGDHAIRMVRDKVRKKVDSMRAFVDVFDPSLAVTAATMTDIAKKSSISLETMTLGRDSVLVTGVARNWNGCDDLLAYLRRLGYEPKLDRKDAGSDGMVPFSIATGGANEP